MTRLPVGHDSSADGAPAEQVLRDHALLLDS
jgi:hypothetical protein